MNSAWTRTLELKDNGVVQNAALQRSKAFSHPSGDASLMTPQSASVLALACRRLQDASCSCTSSTSSEPAFSPREFAENLTALIPLDISSGLHFMKSVNLKAATPARERFRAEAARNEDETLRRLAAFAGGFSAEIWETLAHDVDYRVRYAVLANPDAVKTLSNASLAAAVKGDMAAARALFAALPQAPDPNRDLKDLLAQVKASGNALFVRQLERFEAAEKSGRTRIPATVDEDVEYSMAYAGLHSEDPVAPVDEADSPTAFALVDPDLLKTIAGAGGAADAESRARLADAAFLPLAPIELARLVLQ